MFTSTTSAIHLNNGCIEVNFIGKAARRIIKRDYIPAVFIFSRILPHIKQLIIIWSRCALYV